MTDERLLEAMPNLTVTVTIACANCEREMAAPCFNIEDAAKALGSSATAPNPALKWLKTQLPELVAPNGCVPGTTFRRGLFHAALQPYWLSPVGKKTLAEAIVLRELRVRAAIHLGDYDQERLVEGIDRLIVSVLLNEGSRALYDPRKGANLNTYVTHFASVRIGRMLSQIAELTAIDSDGGKDGDENLAAPTPPQLRTIAPQPFAMVEADWARQVSDAYYDLLEARVREEMIAAAVQGRLMQKADAARSRQQADALARSGRLIRDIACWRPRMVWLLDLHAGPQTLWFPMRVQIPPEVAAELEHKNGTVLERLIGKHCREALTDLLLAPEPQSDPLRALLEQTRAFREKARRSLVTAVEDQDWAAFLRDVAAAGGLRDIPFDAPARLLHLIPWSDVDAQPRGDDAAPLYSRDVLGSRQSRTKTRTRTGDVK